VILLARGESESRGSARSIPAFNIFQALSTCKDLFVRFGGHSMAAGFTIANDNLTELETRLHALADAQLTDDLLQPTLYIDAEADLNDLTWELLDDILRLEPFGQGNQQPVLMSRAVRAVDVRTMGNESRHLRLRLVNTRSSDENARPLNAVAFGLGHLAEPLRKYPDIDIAYTLEANSWQGTRSLQLNVKDFRRST
jgi:single-stranded-DNA-specific exonuclease